MMMRDSNSATSKKRRRGHVPACLAAEEEDRADRDHDEQHPPAAGAAAAPTWTERMHSVFLHSMEAAFVRVLVFGCPASDAAASRRLHQQQLMGAAAAATPGLGRYVPDSPQSTRDGHAGALPPSASLASRIKRSRGLDISGDGCTAAGDISRSHLPQTNGHKATGARRHYPLPRPLKDSDDDQVVPLSQMPEPATLTIATARGDGAEI